MTFSIPDMGAPWTINAIPRRLRAAFPSGERSMPRWRAMAAETGVISSSPTPMELLESFSFSGNKEIQQKISTANTESKDRPIFLRFGCLLGKRAAEKQHVQK